MQARPRQRQELHKFANLTKKHCSFARFARAFLTFARFARAIFIFARFARTFLIFVHFTVVTYQFNSRIASTHFTSQVNWNIREKRLQKREVTFSDEILSVVDVVLAYKQRLPSKNVMPLVYEKNDKLDKDGPPT